MDIGRKDLIKESASETPPLLPLELQPGFTTRAPRTSRAFQGSQTVTNAAHPETITQRPAHYFGKRRTGLARLDLQRLIQVVVERDLQTM